MTEQNCGNCKFVNDPGNKRYQCKRYPMTRHDWVDGYAQKDPGCGEWSPKGTSSSSTTSTAKPQSKN